MQRHPTSVAAHYGGGPDESALAAWAAGLRERLAADSVTYGLVFASPRWFAHAPQLLEILRVYARIPALAGCTSPGLVCGAHELEQGGGLVVQLVHVPGAHARVHALEEGGAPPASATDPVRGWITFADPFHLAADGFVEAWNHVQGGIPVVGGLACGPRDEARTQLYADGRVLERGAVALGLHGAVRLVTGVSQGCTPIGEPWTITRASGSIVEEIANRPAYAVLVDTFEGLAAEEQDRARGNLFAGLAIHEHAEEPGRGDFLVRVLIGADPRAGAIAVGAQVRPGQTIRFHLRDGQAAREDLAYVLGRLRAGLGGALPAAGLLCLCNGRGAHLFGESSHDAGAFQATLGPVPSAGFFCNGELGDIAGRLHVHGYTAAFGLIVPTP